MTPTAMISSCANVYGPTSSLGKPFVTRCCIKGYAPSMFPEMRPRLTSKPCDNRSIHNVNRSSQKKHATNLHGLDPVDASTTISRFLLRARSSINAHRQVNDGSFAPLASRVLTTVRDNVRLRFRNPQCRFVSCSIIPKNFFENGNFFRFCASERDSFAVFRQITAPPTAISEQRRTILRLHNAKKTRPPGFQIARFPKEADSRLSCDAAR